MNYRLVKVDEYKEFQWESGSMMEIAIQPVDSEYRDGDFSWRLSKEVVTEDDSDMNMLDGYDRTVMVLEGDTVFSYEDERVVRLKPLEQDRFSGSSKTKSFGQFTCLDLMVKEGIEGYMDVLEVSETAKTFDNFHKERDKAATNAIYCDKGYCIVKAEQQTIMVREGQLLIMEWGNEIPAYTVMGEGTAVRIQIYEELKEQYVLTDENEENVETSFFANYKACLLIANTQFSLAPHIFRGLRNIWYMPELSAAIAKVKKFCLTVIALLVGTLGIGYIMAVNFNEVQMMAGLLVWFAVYCLIVAPLIYMAMAPKPVSKYIKHLDELSPAERKLRDEEVAQKKYVDSAVRKYDRVKKKQMR